MPDINTSAEILQNATQITSQIQPPPASNLSFAATPIFSNPANTAFDAANAATNTTAAKAPLFANFSWQALVIFGILAIAIVVLIIFAWKRPKSNARNQSSGANSYLKALLITLFAAFIVFLMEGMGWLNEGAAKWGIPIYILLFLFLVWKFSNSKNAMLEKITKGYVLIIRKHLLDWYNAEPIVGNSFGSQIPYVTVKINNGEYGGGDIDVVHYLVLTKSQKRYAVTVGLQSDSILDCIEDPSPEYIEKMWRKIPKPNPVNTSDQSATQTYTPTTTQTPQSNVQPS
jgi:hypothetical protein